MKILITGGAGFIGRHLVKRLSQSNHQLAIIDNLSVNKKLNFEKSVNFQALDITKPETNKFIKAFKPQAVVHLAAENRVTSPVEQIIKNNVIGTFNVLKACQAAKINQFILASSAAIFGESQELPIKEAHPTKPISAYGVSKLTNELHCQLFKNQFKSTILRLANVYGPGQSFASEGGVVAIFINKLLNQTKPNIYGDGQQTRDFVYVADVVDAMVQAIKKPAAGKFNIGSNTSTQIIDLLKLTAKTLNTQPKFIKKPKRLAEIETSIFDIQKAKKHFSWQPKTSLSTGLLQTIESFKTK